MSSRLDSFCLCRLFSLRNPRNRFVTSEPSRMCSSPSVLSETNMMDERSRFRRRVSARCSDKGELISIAMPMPLRCCFGSPFGAGAKARPILQIMSSIATYRRITSMLRSSRMVKTSVMCDLPCGRIEAANRLETRFIPRRLAGLSRIKQRARSCPVSVTPKWRTPRHLLTIR